MFTLIFILGIISGFTGSILSLYLLKIKCPKCKKLKPVKEIILFHWKARTITGQACQQCQRPKPQVSLEL